MGSGSQILAIWALAAGRWLGQAPPFFDMINQIFYGYFQIGYHFNSTTIASTVNYVSLIPLCDHHGIFTVRMSSSSEEIITEPTHLFFSPENLNSGSVSSDIVTRNYLSQFSSVDLVGAGQTLELLLHGS
jgi:hypothetical protein